MGTFIDLPVLLLTSQEVKGQGLQAEIQYLMDGYVIVN